jgi:GR25 family glycosyltransferase involved in LPS biosynthesis
MLVFLLFIIVLVVCAVSIYVWAMLDNAERYQDAIYLYAKCFPDKVLNKLNIPVYYINLDRSTERKEALESHVSEFQIPDVRRVEAFDAKYLGRTNSYNFSDNTVVQLVQQRIPGKLNYQACLLSHLKAIDAAYKDGREYALIVEDDVNLLSVAILGKESLLDLAKSNTTGRVLQLYRMTKKTNKYFENGAVAYLVDRAAMKEFQRVYNGSTADFSSWGGTFIPDGFVYKFPSNGAEYVGSNYFIPTDGVSKSTLCDDILWKIRPMLSTHSSLDPHAYFIRDNSWAYQNSSFVKRLLQLSHPDMIICRNIHFKPVKTSVFGNLGLGMEDVFNIFYTNGKTRIGWEGEGKRVRGEHKFVSYLPAPTGAVWFPFILDQINAHNLKLITDKDFPIITERPFFLAYLNSNTVLERECMFSEILKVRPDAHGLGKCSHNHDIDLGRGEYKENYKVFLQYRFVLVMENKQQGGYLTEKLYSAFVSGAIPVYWGCSESARKFFNTEAYIDIADFETFEACVKFIDTLDNDKERLRQMQSKPVFRNDTVPEEFLWFQKGNSFMDRCVNYISS